MDQQAVDGQRGGIMGISRGAGLLLLILAAGGCSTVSAPQCTPDRGLAPEGLKASLEALNQYLDGFHAYADEDGQAVQARHVSSRVNSDMHACVVYDRRGGDDDLIGVELVISDRLYRELPPEERALWHSHRDPRIAASGETERFESLASTWGQMWYPEDLDPEEARRLVAYAR